MYLKRLVLLLMQLFQRKMRRIPRSPVILLLILDSILYWTLVGSVRKTGSGGERSQSCVITTNDVTYDAKGERWRTSTKDEMKRAKNKMAALGLAAQAVDTRLHVVIADLFMFRVSVVMKVHVKYKKKSRNTLYFHKIL
jgi:hypothetical protein